MRAPVAPKGRLEFLHTNPPLNYVAGHGRGATGFTTRSDIGPALQAPVVPKGRLHTKPPLNYVAGHGRGATGFTTRSDIGPVRASTIGAGGPPVMGRGCGKGPGDEEDTEEKGYDEKQKFDDFEGNDAASADYDGKENKEADAIWEEIDKRMEEENEGYRASNPKTTEQFADLKRKLHTMSTEEWDRIPETGDYSLRNKKKRFESFVPVPDTLLEKAMQEKQSSLTVADLTAVGVGRGAVKLWMQAADQEQDDANKRRVLMKALDHVTDSVRLWKAVVELSNEEEACVLLQRAVECCPLHVEFWLALARLETYENVKKVLNKARKKLSKEPAIWITAAKLEEAANGNSNDSVRKIIERGIETLKAEGLEIDREMWMKEAEAAERAGSVETCRAIIRKTIEIGVEGEDRKRTWVADAGECKTRGSIETARAIYAHALAVFPTKKGIWLKAAELEKSHGTRESLDTLLQKAVMYVPRAQTLRLMGAKEKWLAVDVPAARGILQQAYAALPDSEEIWLAAFKLEFENSEPERARRLLVKARERGGTEKVWMKSAVVERELGNTAEERSLLDEGLKRYPSFYKLWLMLGQLEERLGNLDQAKGAYELGLKHCSSCVPLWLSLAHLEEKVNGLSKARAVLTMARTRNPKNPELWLAAVRAESRHENDKLIVEESKKESDQLMAKALQECPKSGTLWGASIEMVPRKEQKMKSKDAYTSCGEDPHVLAAVGKLFWHDRKFDLSRSYFNRIVTLAPEIGDFWALYYKFEMQHGTEENQKDVLSRCVAAGPKHGEKWLAVSKAVENSHLPTQDILKKVVRAMGKEELHASSSS